MTVLKQDEFKELFDTDTITATLRHAVRISPDLKKDTLKEAQEILLKWAKRRLIVSGYSLKETQTMMKDFDFGSQTGIALSLISNDKDKWHPARYMHHLFQACETLEAQLEHERQLRNKDIFNAAKAESTLQDIAQEHPILAEPIYEKFPHLEPIKEWDDE